MLVLTRKLDQSILIGTGIKITVVAINHNRIRLGIKAPDDVPIFREELLTQRAEIPQPGGAHTIPAAVPHHTQ